MTAQRASRPTASRSASSPPRGGRAPGSRCRPGTRSDAFLLGPGALPAAMAACLRWVGRARAGRQAARVDEDTVPSRPRM